MALLQSWLLISAGGFLVGFLVGMTGVGAGSLMTPFLISVIGVPAPTAVGTDLLFASITKASAAFRHNAMGNVDWRMVRYLAAGSLPGALVMIGCLYALKPETAALAGTIHAVLSVALVVSALAILLYPWLVKRRAGRVIEAAGSPGEAGEDATAGKATVRPLPTVLLGVTLGSLVALTSVGAGAIGVVVLSALYPALATRRLIGTDIVHAIPLTFVSGASHLAFGNVDVHVLLALLVGSVPGIALGSRLTGVLPDWLLRTALACTLLYASYSLAHKA